MAGTALFFVACGLLVAAGVAKTLRPAAAVAAVASVGVDAPPVALRLLGGGEIAVGVLGLIAGGRAGVLVAALYGSFAVFVTVAIRRGAKTDCGCFGSAGAPLGVGHIVIVTVAAFVAVAAWFLGSPGIGGTGWSGIEYLAAAIAIPVAVFAVSGLMTALPEAMREVAAPAARLRRP